MIARDRNITMAYTAAQRAINDAAKEYNLQPLEMRILMCIADCADSDGNIDSLTIEEMTGIYASNVRRALPRLRSAMFVEWVVKRRGERLVVTVTPLGHSAALDCFYRWREQVEQAATHV